MPINEIILHRSTSLEGINLAWDQILSSLKSLKFHPSDFRNSILYLSVLCKARLRKRKGKKQKKNKTSYIIKNLINRIYWI